MFRSPDPPYALGPRWGGGGDLEEVSSEPLWSSLSKWELAVALESESGSSSYFAKMEIRHCISETIG